jgi:hypothetical protein
MRVTAIDSATAPPAAIEPANRSKSHSPLIS